MKEKLKNAPIKETVIGLGISDYSFGDIKGNPIYSELSKIYTKIAPTYNGEFKIENGICSQNTQICGYSFCNKESTERVFLDNNRIAFSDKNKYENFDVFFKKFQKVFNIINKVLSTNKFSVIALRQVNVFLLGQEELYDQKNMPIKFFPNFSLYKEEPVQFAQLAQFSGTYNLQSQQDTRMKATIKSSLQFVGQPPKLQVIFDINTLFDISKENKPLENIEDYLTNLRSFKNDIFFSNISSDIKEFSNE